MSREHSGRLPAALTDYIGILVNGAVLPGPSSNFYLRRGCEVLFAPEHVLRLEQVEAIKKATDRLEAEPALRWPYRV